MLYCSRELRVSFPFCSSRCVIYKLLIKYLLCARFSFLPGLTRECVDILLAVCCVSSLVHFRSVYGSTQALVNAIALTRDIKRQ